ncbi:MAG TPA: hypothetical protein VN625_02090, partial [Desulfuromonadaceae bacterium]|nr:hypothetical protein [Desulfuromonadaceae bacterium]
MKKIIIGSVIVLLIIGLIAWKVLSPPVIKFPDGATVTLLSVDYGKHHVPPVKHSERRRRNDGSFDTPDNALIAWFKVQHPQDTSSDFNFYACDKAGTAVGSSDQNDAGPPDRQGTQIVGVEFDAFPRRQGTFYIGVQRDVDGNAVLARKKFAVRNPVRNTFEKWTAESMPATKTDDDFSVTLTKLTMDPPGGDPDEQKVHLSVHTEYDGKPVDNWRPVSVVTSDATGNNVDGEPDNEEWKNGDGTFDYQSGLWHDEAAWKIEVEFSQEFDFDEKDLWVVRDLPFEPASRRDMWNSRRERALAPAAETTIDGCRLRIAAAKFFTNAPAGAGVQGGFVIQVEPGLPEGT